VRLLEWRVGEITIGWQFVAVAVVVVLVVEMEENHPDMSNFIHFRVCGRDV
jgi:hypothetical protein